jgi:hypothetical protein
MSTDGRIQKEVAIKVVPAALYSAELLRAELLRHVEFGLSH